MNRHGYKGRKFGRETDQRRALINSLAEALITHESIETTLPKAKELIPYMERLITKAKDSSLHSRRLIISKLQTISSAHKLIDDLAPKLKNRSSGHLKLERTVLRRGDNAQLARVSFVDDLAVAQPAKSSEPIDMSKKTITKKSQSSSLKTQNSKPAAKKINKTPKKVAKG